MQVQDIQVGKTYEGSTGEPRTVVEIKEPLSNSGRFVCYRTPDELGHVARMEEFAAWAKFDAPTDLIDEFMTGVRERRDTLTGKIAVLREALEKIACSTIGTQGLTHWVDDARDIARTALAATDVIGEEQTR